MNKILLFSFVVLLSSCATILSTNIRNVGINSHPQKAKIRVTNQIGQIIFEGQTPVILPLKLSIASFTAAEYNIAFSKDSFQQHKIILKAKYNWVSALNIAFPPGFPQLLTTVRV